MDERLIAVTGATGRQGGAVARHLLAGGWRVRALTRDPASRAAQALAGRGAEVVRADMGDVDSLLSAFAGAHGVYSVQNGVEYGMDAEVAQGKAVADAAAKSGVDHLVYGSAGVGRGDTGVESWDCKEVVKAHIEKVGVPFTVLRPMAFMELMSDKRFFPPVAVWSVMPRLMGEDRPVVWIGVDDLGAIAARVFATPELHIGEDIALVADVRSIRECRELWREVTGSAPRRFPMPTWLFERVASRDLARMWRWLRENPTDVSRAPTLALHPTARTVRQWMEELHAR
ncbi:NmrA/HSCARG family protein [Actinokineospora soli]|uniref:NmrA/HSCARG family protein n=1 Tax=Actinokineospora soli TaxID=1048753 RepID=A0ABW2TL88_9PSEU